MAVSYFFSQNPALLGLMPAKFLFAAPIFGFGLVASDSSAWARHIAGSTATAGHRNAQSVY